MGSTEGTVGTRDIWVVDARRYCLGEDATFVRRNKRGMFLIGTEWNNAPFFSTI